MDWLSKVDWAKIIEAAASSPLGIAALAFILLSIVIVVLFGKDKNSWVRLTAFLLIVVGILGIVLVIVGETRSEIKRIENLEDEAAEKARIKEEIAACKRSGVEVENQCRAYDKSGFHSSPSASCPLELKAGSGRFFAQEHDALIASIFKQSIQSS